MPRQTWIADAIRQELNRHGVTRKVTEESGWRTRGNSTFTPRGVMAHHTATAIVSGNPYPTRNVLIRGHGSLPGPLCQVGIDRNGNIYIVAAGRANHAGPGSYNNISGNTSWFGIEVENNGRGEPWSPKVMLSYHIVTAALLRGIKKRQNWAPGHKEYATPRGRKVDPNFSMPTFRSNVGKALDRNLVNVVHKLGDRTLYLTGPPRFQGPDVEELQRLLNKAEYRTGNIDGIFGPNTAQSSSTFANENMGVKTTAESIRVGPKTVAALRAYKPAPPDPWEEFMSSLTNKQRNRLIVLADSIGPLRTANLVRVADLDPEIVDLAIKISKREVEVHKQVSNSVPGDEAYVIRDTHRPLVDTKQKMKTDFRHLWPQLVRLVRIAKAMGEPIDDPRLDANRVYTRAEIEALRKNDVV